ncbi:MAG: 16S rRNA (guanine(966)-N(2))-methyltransferase RsmD [Candidatus Eiseniibacteriota bacterium]
MIAGELRGRILHAPEGLATRPTSDRVRESLFALLGDVIEGARVLDLYAGSGALGIEALSRGAVAATFVERESGARRVLERNLSELGLGGRARVLAADAMSEAALRGGPFDVVLADPPYGETDLGGVVRHAAEALAPGGVLVLEHPAKEAAPPVPETLAPWKARRYGGTTLTLWVRDKEAR